MPNFPLHPILFISLVILVGFALAPLLAYIDKHEQKKQSISNANQFLIGVWILAGVFTITIVNFMLFTKNGTQTSVALAPLGMMIAALIASASVMKNIAETKKNEAEKHEKEDSKFYLEQCIKSLEHVYDLLSTQQSNPLSWKEAAEILIDMRTLSQYITKEAHKKVFTLEYKKYSSKLLNSFTKTSFIEDSHPLLPSFFCFIRDWEKTNLQEAFEKTTMRMNPEYIVTIFQFSQPLNNTFLTNTTNNQDWYTINFDQLKKQLPWMCAVDYINLYKKSEITKYSKK